MNKKEAIEIIKKNWPDSRYTMLQEALQTLIPELKESEDEMIRQDIIDWLINYKDNVQVDLKDEEVDRWVSCLEKQGEQENLCDKCRKEQPSHSCQDITALGRCALEKQGEQNPVECIKFDNEFENQVSHLIASVLNGEHEYNEGFVKYASQSLLGFVKKEQKSIEQDTEIRDLWVYIREWNEKFGRLPKDEDELAALIDYVTKRQKPAVIIPKFRVGDKIRRKTLRPYDKDMQVASIEGDYYICNHLGKFSSETISFSEESNYELVEEGTPVPLRYSEGRLARILWPGFYVAGGMTTEGYALLKQTEEDLKNLFGIKDMED